MRLKGLELLGFKSFAKKTELRFDSPITAVVGPNGSGKSNIAEACRWVLGEQSLKSLRGRRGEDFIWNGAGRERSNRATVSLTLDNDDRKLPLDYDEICIGREVYRDGSNTYTINDSVVRLRDVSNLLQAVSIGPSGYHIMSQGEADRLLTANGVERRQMIEDALGLKIYQTQIVESEKKLEKTKENLREVELLRREIAPHLRFLKKEMEKIERSRELRAELKSLGIRYFFCENRFLLEEIRKIEQAMNPSQREFEEISKKLEILTQESDRNKEGEAFVSKSQKLEEKSLLLVKERTEISRLLGRLEGKLEASRSVTTVKVDEMISRKVFLDLSAFFDQLLIEIKESSFLSQSEIVARLEQFQNRLRSIIKFDKQDEDQVTNQLFKKLEEEKIQLGERLKTLEIELIRIAEDRRSLENERETQRQELEGAQREIFDLKLKKTELQGEINALTNRREMIKQEQEIFQRLLEETALLTDRELFRYAELADQSEEADRKTQEERRRQLEKFKIQLEDVGVESGDVLSEYNEVTERESFLAKETEDLLQSVSGLEKVLEELKEKCIVEFDRGLDSVNKYFQNFFEILFGGGDAKLSLVIDRNEPEETEESSEEIRGVEVSVNLPRKKIRGLEMLSGGERALTSIALLFAISQVNPPPFLILDETDAALDEANSRRYGELVRILAKHSQLILVTHNRETMSHAGVIYGVTMGSDGISRLLSIKLDEAVEYAK